MENGVHQTRCQVAPDWTPGESLTLANEINNVEVEWGNSLSSFQKWQLVVENCSALDINRSLNQCKKKWHALRSDYERIKAWKGGYWSFDVDKRIDMGLPEEFDEELFRVISRYFKQKGDDVSAPETDPDSDAEAQARTKRMFLQTGPKKQRKRRTACKSNIGERLHPWRHILGGIMKPVAPSSLNGGAAEDPARGAGQMRNQTVKPEQCGLDEIPEDEPISTLKKRKTEHGVNRDREREKMMTAKLLENAQLVNAILEGSLAEDVDFKLADLKNSEAMEAAFVRRQGDKIIDCLGNIVNTLSQFCNVLQEGKLSTV